MPPEVVFIVVVSIVAVTIWVWVGVKYGTQQSKPEALEGIEKRLARLEVAIDDLTTELSRVTEGQQFTNKLLSDRSPEMIRALAKRDPRVVGVFFGRNRGQTAATAAGVHLARGRLIATLDADLQNDPGDLPAMSAGSIARAQHARFRLVTRCSRGRAGRRPAIPS